MKKDIATNLHNKVLTSSDELILSVYNGLEKSEILKNIDIQGVPQKITPCFGGP